MDYLPFDGYVVEMGGGTARETWQNAFDVWPFDQNGFMEAKTLLVNTPWTSRLVGKNFLWVNASTGQTSSEDFWGNVDNWVVDDQLIRPASKFQALASVVGAAAGLSGMLFDAEIYGGSNNPWQISNPPATTCVGSDLARFRALKALVQDRGLRLGLIFQQKAPTKLFRTMYMLSVLNGYGDLGQGDPLDSALCLDPNGLLLPFLMGFLDVPQQLYVPVVDGNEYWYYAKDACDYWTIFDAIKNHAINLLPPDYRARYASTVTVSQPIFLNYLMAESPLISCTTNAPTYCLLPLPHDCVQQTQPPPANLALLRYRVYSTLQWSDRYAWVWSEALGGSYPAMNLLINAGGTWQSLQDEIIRNIREGRDAFMNNPVTYDRAIPAPLAGFFLGCVCDSNCGDCRYPDRAGYPCG
jgi:hypothetical protein